MYPLRFAILIQITYCYFNKFLCGWRLRATHRLVKHDVTSHARSEDVSTNVARRDLKIG